MSIALLIIIPLVGLTLLAFCACACSKRASDREDQRRAELEAYFSEDGT